MKSYKKIYFITLICIINIHSILPSNALNTKSTVNKNSRINLKDFKIADTQSLLAEYWVRRNQQYMNFLANHPTQRERYIENQVKNILYSFYNQNGDNIALDASNLNIIMQNINADQSERQFIWDCMKFHHSDIQLTINLRNNVNNAYKQMCDLRIFCVR